MAFACIVPVAPLRAEPSHRSEMVSQLLFGELCDVLETQTDFLKVRCHYDGYEGWCQGIQLVDYEAENYFNSTCYVEEAHATIYINNEAYTVPFGSVLEKNNDERYQIGPYQIETKQFRDSAVPTEFNVDVMVELAKPFLGTAYLWGGKSIFGVDCSGFVQQLYKQFGIWLPRDAYQQAEIGEPVGFLQESKLGDLAFFDNEEGRITHVGLLLSDRRIIHASGNVRIDPIDHAGIMHSITGKRTHRLRLIKRIVNH
jgi:hypothetical protein